MLLLKVVTVAPFTRRDTSNGPLPSEFVIVMVVILPATNTFVRLEFGRSTPGGLNSRELLVAIRIAVYSSSSTLNDLVETQFIEKRAHGSEFEVVLDHVRGGSHSTRAEGGKSVNAKAGTTD